MAVNTMILFTSLLPQHNTHGLYWAMSEWSRILLEVDKVHKACTIWFCILANSESEWLLNFARAQVENAKAKLSTDAFEILSNISLLFEL